MSANLTELGFATGWSVLPRLPKSLLSVAFDAVGTVVARRGGRSVDQLRANLRRIVGPELPDAAFDELTRRSMRSYARYWREVFQLPRWDRRDIYARTTVSGEATVQKAVDDGRGVLMALPHSGNWDTAAIWVMEHFGVPITTVAERLQPESLYERFARYRRGLGMELLPLSGGERGAGGILAERLKQGRIVCLLADRDLTTGGLRVDFLGEPTTVPAGPAMLAATTGAALVPLDTSFTPDGWRMVFDAEIPVDGDGRLRARVMAAGQRLADSLAAGIASHPEDWHMLQPFWTADRAGE